MLSAGMHSGPELTVALLASLALAAGAAVRLMSKRARFPYTVAMLVLGLVVGVILRRLGPGMDHNLFAHAVRAGAEVSPDGIIFVFLPALIFESAYGVDLHTFRKDAGAVVLLALPALVIATGLTAGFMVLVSDATGAWPWGWTGALVFGALISATDPVAVVAVLRSVGAPKRLAVLIEGESLFNDGTSIVLFTVLLALLTGGATATLDPGAVLLRFVWVVAGGIGVGLLLAFAASAWIGRTFNDPMVEITLTLALAYAAMILGEGVLHVSGVMAVVTAGLWMGGPGQTRISPEVLHFLHRFWEMLAYVANTLIFCLVGLVIASQVEEADATALLMTLAVYVAILLIRFAVTYAFRPLMGLVGEPVSAAEAAVMSWGGLRGAVSLALALVVSRHPDVPSHLGSQILIATAGIVLLTILINGTTTGWLLRRLGFDRTPEGDAIAHLTVQTAVLVDVEERIEKVSQSKDLRAVPWGDVRRDLTRRVDEMRTRIAELRDSLGDDDPATRTTGYWRQALAIERGAVWKAFADGTLGAAATRILSHELELHLDRLAAGDLTPRGSRVAQPRGVLQRISRLTRNVGVDFVGMRFQRFSLLYDLYRGEILAAEKVLGELDHAPGDEHVVQAVRDNYRAVLMNARERIEDLRTNLPELTQAIEQRLARRTQLNFERDALEDRLEEGALQEEAGKAALTSVEERMKALRLGATRLPLPETADLCRNTPLFAGLDDAAMTHLARITVEQLLSPGEVLFEAGSVGNSLFVVARGAVHVVRRIDGEDVLVDVLAGGDIVGEMSLLTGAPRGATVRAATTVTVGEIRRADFDELMASLPQARAQIFRAFERRLFDNHAQEVAALGDLSHDDRIRWVDAGRTVEVPAGDGARIERTDAWLFVVIGSVELEAESLTAPALRQLRGDELIVSAQGARIRLLPPRPAPA